MKFYVVHTYTGHEAKVKKMLLEKIKSEGCEDQFGEIIIPQEHIARIKEGKKVVEERRIYPGYIIVEMNANQKTLSLVTSIPGVTHFLGPRRKPTPLSKKEVEELMEQLERSRDRIVSLIPFHKGDRVKITEGPFTDFIGIVDEIFPDRARVKVLVTIFGRTTPVEFSFDQVKSF